MNEEDEEITELEVEALWLNDLIIRNLKEEFEEVHLSGNLAKTIYFHWNKNDFTIYIPAIRYDIDKWRKDKVIVYTPEKGSYAEVVNKTGGFSHTHRDYVENAIYDAIDEWARICGYDISTKETY